MYRFEYLRLQNVLVVLWLCLSLFLTACGGSGGADSASSTTQRLQGKAIKGVISNGLVTASRWESDEQQAVELASARTDASGGYQLDIPRQPSDALILLELRADAATRMICDIPAGCEQWNSGAIAAFGQPLPLPDGFRLLGLYDQNTARHDLTPFSHIEVTTAQNLPGGLTEENLQISRQWIADVFNPNGSERIDYTALDLTQLPGNATEPDLLYSVLAAGFYPISLSAQWSEAATQLDNLPLSDLFLAASEIASDLSLSQAASAPELSATFHAISTDTEASYQELITQELVINSQPLSTSVNEGESFILRVWASSAQSIQYQWYKDNQLIPGANSASYGVSHANLNDSGLYRVAINDGLSTLQSQSALVRINEVTLPVTILQHPVSRTLTEGDPLSLSVEASGDGPFEYVWQKNGSLIPGQTSSTLYIAQTTASDAGSYRALVSNDVSSVHSNFATVNITTSVQAVAITRHPEDVTSTVGGTVQFNVQASGGGFVRYQWEKNGLPIDGETTAVLALSGVNSEDAGSYRVIVSNSRGSVISNSATLSVISNELPVSISRHPVSTSVQTGDPVTLSVLASGGGNLNYQWRFNGLDIIGASSSSLTIDNASIDDSGLYTVRVANSSSSELSNAALLTVNPAPVLRLSWNIPTQREDGSPLELYEIGGYRIEYGTQSDSLDGTVIISDAATTETELQGLNPGTLFLRIATIDAEGVTGRFSETISITIP